MDSTPSNNYLYNENLNHFLELIGQINSNLELSSVLLNIIQAAKEITRSEASSVFLLDKDTDELILTVPTGPVRDKIHGRRFPKSQGIAGWVATHAETQIVNDVSKDERFYGDFEPDVFTTRNILCVPLKNQSDEVIGVLQAINKKENANYQENEVSLFRALAHQAAIAITNARLHEERKTLLSEIHHRVKNNMAIISGMIHIQAFNEPDKELQTKLLKSVTRISSMATVHEQLYESESFSSLNYTKNLEKVVEQTLQTIETNQTISRAFSCDPVTLNINQSIPCSLIVSEILFHIGKFGFSTTEKPGLTIRLSENSEDQITIEIEDNGESIKNYLSGSGDDDTAFQLINILSKQMEAEFNYKSVSSKNVSTISFRRSDNAGSGNKFL